MTEERKPDWDVRRVRIRGGNFIDIPVVIGSTTVTTDDHGVITGFDYESPPDVPYGMEYVRWDRVDYIGIVPKEDLADGSKSGRGKKVKDRGPKSRCEGTTRTGDQCKRNATVGEFCQTHSGEEQERRDEAARIHQRIQLAIDEDRLTEDEFDSYQAARDAAREESGGFIATVSPRDHFDDWEVQELVKQSFYEATVPMWRTWRPIRKVS